MSNEKEEARLMKLFDDVSTPESSSESEYEPDESERSSIDDADVAEADDASDTTEDEENDVDQCVNTTRNNEDDDETWHQDVKDIPNFCFDESNCGVKFSIDKEMTPFDIFSKLFDNEILDILVNSTNDYGMKLTTQSRPHTQYSRKTKFKATNFEEMKKFFGLCLLQGQIPVPSVRKLFTYDRLYYHPIFLQTMSGRRFEQILRCLTVECKEELYKNHRLMKIKHFLNTLIKKFQNAYYPSKQLSLDESLLLFRGRLSFRTYMKGKKSKYGIKLYELCTPGGYVLNIEVYKGKTDEGENNPNMTKLQNLVMRIMGPYLDKGHHLYMDNYYNTIPLSKLLLTRNTYTTGTLRSNRIGVPVDITKTKLRKSEHIWRRCNNVYVSKWKDKRDVLCITTGYHPQMIISENRRSVKILKPLEIAEYNKYMSGIDRADQMIAYYSCPRKTIRWYKKLIFHLLDIAVWNSYNIFKTYVNPHIKYIDFRDKLIRQLLNIENESKNVSKVFFNKSSKISNISTPSTSTTETDKNTTQHFIAKMPLPENHKRKTYFLRCKQCSKNKKRKETSWYCKTCETTVPLCPGECFEKWHAYLQ